MRTTSSTTPCLCLLPGLDGTGKLFGRLIPYLTRQCQVRVVRYTNIDSFAELVATVEAQLPAGKPISLVAESFSGPVAIELLARKKKEIGPSVFCATFAGAPLRPLLKVAKVLPTLAFDQRIVKRLALNFFGLNSLANQPLKYQAAAVINSVGGATLQQRLAMLSEIDVRDRLQHIDAHVLYLRAKADRLVSPAFGNELMNGISRITLAEINGPHLLLQHQPEICAKKILEHVITNNNTALPDDSPELAR